MQVSETVLGRGPALQGTLPDPSSPLLLLPAFRNCLGFLVAVTDKFTESMYVLANEPSVALYRLQEHVRRSLPELAQHKVSRASFWTLELRHSRAQAVFPTWHIIPISPPLRGGKEGRNRPSGRKVLRDPGSV